MIEIIKLNKIYSSKPILKNLNVKFNRGNIYGLVGSNGSGKTTFFECISGLESYTGIVQFKSDLSKKKLGYLKTDPFFFEKITGLEYLHFICNARNIKLNNIQEKNIFDLPLNRYATTYSTGMKKKLAFLGILLQKNDVLLLDEPFNGVDLESNILIMEILLRLKNENKIIVMASHFFSTLRDCCDVILYLKNGRIVNTVDRDNFDLIEEDLKRISLKKKLNQFDKF